MPKRPNNKRKTKPRSKRPIAMPKTVAVMPHRFLRRTSVTYPISFGNVSTFGWNNAGTNALQLYVSLQYLHCDYGGSSNSVQFSGYTDFTSLFDEWTIEAVKYSFYWNNNMHSSSGVNGLPVLLFIEDFSDSLPLGSSGEAFQYGNCQVKQLGNNRGEDPGLHVSQVPKFALTTNAGGTGVISSGWVNSLYPDTLFRGYKIWLMNNGTTDTDGGEVTIVAEAKFACRIPR